MLKWFPKNASVLAQHRATFVASAAQEKAETNASGEPNSGEPKKAHESVNAAKTKFKSVGGGSIIHPDLKKTNLSKVILK